MLACECGFHLLCGFNIPTHPTNATPHRRANLIHPELIRSVVSEYPRPRWSECFAGVLMEELKLKPWCHTSTFEVPGYKPGDPSHFATNVRGNDAMRPYE
jgi:cyanamide hydratase